MAPPAPRRRRGGAWRPAPRSGGARSRAARRIGVGLRLADPPAARVVAVAGAMGEEVALALRGYRLAAQQQIVGGAVWPVIVDRAHLVERAGGAGRAGCGARPAGAGGGADPDRRRGLHVAAGAVRDPGVALGIFVASLRPRRAGGRLRPRHAEEAAMSRAVDIFRGVAAG